MRDRRHAGRASLVTPDPPSSRPGTSQSAVSSSATGRCWRRVFHMPARCPTGRGNTRPRLYPPSHMEQFNEDTAHRNCHNRPHNGGCLAAISGARRGPLSAPGGQLAAKSFFEPASPLSRPSCLESEQDDRASRAERRRRSGTSDRQGISRRCARHRPSGKLHGIRFFAESLPYGGRGPPRPHTAPGPALSHRPGLTHLWLATRPC